MTALTGYGAVLVGSRTVTRPEVEDWLYAEADILDAWDYDGWLALFEPGARYEIPTTDYLAGPRSSPGRSSATTGT